ncbi:MAG: hypothetical protein ACYDH5_06425 [Acidimicrobiales bacterium]
MGPESEGEPHALGEEQHAELEASHAHRDRTLEAMHRLEAALGSAAPGRELAWRDEVLAALVASTASSAGPSRRCATSWKAPVATRSTLQTYASA